MRTTTLAKLSQRELSTILDAEKKDALSADSASKLSEDRERAMNYYMGDMTMDIATPKDRSAAVSTDVLDTVEGLMPGLMEIFCSGDEVVSFEPQGAEDEDAAEQETDYVNYVFHRLNPGFTVLYTMIKDALLQKVGVVKVWWDTSEYEEEEVYTDLDDAAFGMIMDDPEIEVVGHTERGSVMFPPGMEPETQFPEEAALQSGQPPLDQGPNSQYGAAQQGPGGVAPSPAAPPGMAMQGMGMPGPSDMGMQGMGTPGDQSLGTDQYGGQIMERRHDVTVRRRKEIGIARVEAVPPEEFGITRRAKSIQDSDYCFHEVKKTVGELIALGYDPEQLLKLGTARLDDNEESVARDTVEETATQGQSSNLNKMTRLVVVTEHYCLIDYEGDNKPCLYRVVTGGEGTTEILERNGEPDIEKIDAIPFAAMSPYIQPHRFYGRSVADLVFDIQRIKTSLLRSLLDNIYLANNQRMEISETHAGDNTIDDLLTNRPGGIVRTKMPGGLIPIPSTSIGNFAYPMVEYMDATREWRTGVTRQGMGLDPNALQNIGENAILDAANAARQKQKLIARIFAETGIGDLFKLLHKTIRRNDSKENTIRLRNKWVTINPREWKNRNNLIVHVGLGDGTKPQQTAFLMNLLQVQREAAMMPQMKLVQPKNIYNTLDRLIQINGLRNIEQYFSDPEKGPPVPAPPDPKIEIEKMKMQGDQQKMQMDAQLRGQELQMKAMLEEKQAEADIISDNRKSENEMIIKQKEFELKRELAMLEFQLKEQEHQQKMASEFDMAMLKHQEVEHKLDAQERQTEIKIEGEREKQSMQAEAGQQQQAFAQDDHERKIAEANAKGGSGNGKAAPAKRPAAPARPTSPAASIYKALTDQQAAQTEALKQLTQAILRMQENADAPSEVIRDADNKIVGVRKVTQRLQ